MKTFWNGLAKLLVKAALWAATHPQVVQAVVTEAAALVKP